jgi:hypothetical protein
VNSTARKSELEPDLPHEDGRVELLTNHKLSDPDHSAFVLRALLIEAEKNVFGPPESRVFVRGFTFATHQVFMHARFFGADEEARKQRAAEARVLFGQVAHAALRGTGAI